ncbi:metallophosphoesterase family protein [Anaerosphaera multitolerans]|uniref:DNA repair exonuclease n=1 Tax=Anaerosphaera multitolerans TaxID=2487351 RepID=A0A437S772_9FIRM|nr:DNA repair exonuclease [Anaerosphaera multitolerans]RVU54821.1 DNA repair exonuclease [Anaerosphaera multitolerans]
MKILHTADLHLGRFYKGELPREISSLRREELWKSFTNTINYIEKNNIEVFLICGDIYEREFFTLADMLRFSELINSLKNTYTFIVGGNHDYIDENSLLYKVDFNEKVHIFKGSEYFDIDELNLRVHGISWNRQFDFSADLNFEIDKSKTNILMLHGTVGGRSHFPLDLKAINSYEFDYIALGHIHLSQRIQENCYYCGCPEALSFSETGGKGFIVVELDKGVRKVEFIENSIRNYNEIFLDIEEDMSIGAILEKFHLLLRDKEDDLNRIVVRGNHNRPGYVAEVLKGQKDYFYIEIIDELSLSIPLKELYRANSDNIIGRYIELAKDDEKLLSVGLRALLEAKDED